MSVADGFFLRCVKNSRDFEDAVGMVVSGPCYVNPCDVGQGLGEAFGGGGKRG